ncbi:MAG TPA: hypothetical protein VN656_04440 [Stellaceae bacterium]|jgi:hypothetical protein|nr:hypothetical protein [Stellaceae bacterium]
MADPTNLIEIESVGNIIAAVAALGTASMGFVDVMKAFNGGPSNFGFSSIKRTLLPFLPKQANGAFNEAELLDALKSNWINGVAKADQKAKAKALIHLGLTAGNAAELAKAAGVDEKTLASVADKVAGRSQQPLTPAETNTLGQFDAILSAVLDEAYERADQQYRNGTKILAMIVAVIFGIIASGLINAGGFSPGNCVLGLIVGLVSVPLAPVAKDLVSSLQAASGALQLTQRGIRR